nr:beta-1,6-galactosyltransferase GALT29A [Ipomoea batatas]
MKRKTRIGNPFAKMPIAVVFIDTLLKYASLDIGEPQLRKEVDELLEVKLKGTYTILYWSGEAYVMKRNHSRCWYFVAFAAGIMNLE